MSTMTKALQKRSAVAAQSRKSFLVAHFYKLIPLWEEYNGLSDLKINTLKGKFCSVTFAIPKSDTALLFTIYDFYSQERMVAGFEALAAYLKGEGEFPEWNKVFNQP